MPKSSMVMFLRLTRKIPKHLYCRIHDIFGALYETAVSLSELLGPCILGTVVAQITSTLDCKRIPSNCNLLKDE